MSINWHADGDGKCHAECPAWYRGCVIVASLPWLTDGLRPDADAHTPGPFAVLADVLGMHQRKQTDKSCKVCKSSETRTTITGDMTDEQRRAMATMIDAFFPQAPKESER